MVHRKRLVHGAAGKVDFNLSLSQPKGRLRTLLDQNEVYDKLLLEFLQATGDSRLSWIHEIKLKRHSAAATQLLDAASKTKVLAEQKVRFRLLVSLRLLLINETLRRCSASASWHKLLF